MSVSRSGAARTPTGCRGVEGDAMTSHGKLTSYRHGCRCEPCVAANSAQCVADREARRERRVEFGGRLVADLPFKSHGKLSTYKNHGCRCEPCAEASRAAAKVSQSLLRRARYDARVRIAGRLVAPVPKEKHGMSSTYTNHGCRCDPCSSAHSTRGSS